MGRARAGAASATTSGTKPPARPSDLKPTGAGSTGKGGRGTRPGVCCAGPFTAAAVTAATLPSPAAAPGAVAQAAAERERAGFFEKRWCAASASAAVAQGVSLDRTSEDGRTDAAGSDHSSGSRAPQSSSSLTSNGYRDMICLLCRASYSSSPCQGPPLRK